MQQFSAKDASFFYDDVGSGFEPQNIARDKPLVIWAHGWGQSHAAFLPLAQPFLSKATHVFLDLPGFGQSPPPPAHWGTEDYANAIADWLARINAPPVIWIGHSFGCRVGLRLAQAHPHLIKTLCLIAGAGLKRKRPLHKKIYFYLRIRLFKALKKLIPEGDFKNKIMAKFGSADYKNAGPMKTIFIRTVNEDLTETARGVTCPVTLVYGEHDTETPVEFGERYSRLIPNANLIRLEGQDHYSVLAQGRHPVIKIIGNLITP